MTARPWDSSQPARSISTRCGARRYVAYMLSSTARSMDLPLVVSDVVFTDLGAEERARVEEALDTSGLDPYFVKVFQAPEPVRAPPAFYVALVALSLIVVGVSVSMARTHAAALRRILGSLVAVGVPASWARRVVLVEIGLSTAVAAALALLIAGPISATALARLPGFDFSVPWDWFALIVASCLGASVLGALLATARLRPGDRDLI